jgi:hypothetical protein
MYQSRADSKIRGPLARKMLQYDHPAECATTFWIGPQMKSKPTMGTAPDSDPTVPSNGNAFSLSEKLDDHNNQLSTWHRILASGALLAGPFVFTTVRT